jgi:two-component sensor histidine kinase
MTEFSGQRVLALDQLLLQELNHRVNNEFTAAISAISVAAARSDNNEVKASLSGVAELLHRYADVHHALQVSDHNVALQAEMYLRQLCCSIGRSYLDYLKIKLTLTTEPLCLEANRCWCLGMIVYELIINSARHAFSGEGGQIRVALRSVGTVAECSVIDNGSVPIKVAPGRGRKIMDELSKSLGGRLVQKFGPKGARSILTFPCTGTPRVIGEPQRRRFHAPGHAVASFAEQ